MPIVLYVIYAIQKEHLILYIFYPFALSVLFILMLAVFRP
jgi:hypothetical protein